MTTSQKIKHLSWRAGFGCSPQEWKDIQNFSLLQAIDLLFEQAQKANTPQSKYQDYTDAMGNRANVETRKAIRNAEKQFLIEQNAQWVKRMADPKESMLLEKMSLFWHGHFACVIKHSKLAHKQLLTIRKHALGNFRIFAKAMARDAAMIRFLNNQQNKKKQPNENFARELMELFTIGRGNYTEQDIKEAARAFTGWSSDLQGDFKFRRRQHDFGQKNFMGKTGNFDGDEIIDIILNRRETAHYIVNKIYRFFVNEKPNPQHINFLTDRFFQKDYDIADLMRTIFSSDWFYAKPNVGTRIKSPIELVAGMMRSLNVEFESSMPILFIERALGQVLFKPPNVAGWPGGKQWIDNSTLMFRLNLPSYLFEAAEVNLRVKEEFEAKARNKAIRRIKANLELDPVIKLTQGQAEQTAFNTFSNYFLQTTHKVNEQAVKPHLNRRDRQSYVESLCLRLMSLPEYQLC